MKPRVYIETTIPSYYYEIRSDPESVVKGQWTRDWWDEKSSDYELWISPVVIEELEKGDYPFKAKALELIRDLPVLPLKDDIIDIANAYLSHYLMPKSPLGDALHLAIASYYHCHFLLTWNCNHLANANKFEHIRHVNTMLGLFVPILTTPIELMSE